MEKNEALYTVLKSLEDSGLLKDIILIGSWCLVFYQQIFEGFEPQIRTTDIDFYVPNAKSANPGDSAAALKKINYDHVRDTLTNKSTFISPDGFEIEFLTNLTKEGLSAVRLGASEIYAESLSYIGMYSGHYVDVTYFGIKLHVASPAAFVIQKALINDRRGLKAEKDRLAIAYVASFIPLSRKSRDEFYSLFDSLPKKWKKEVMNFLETYAMEIPPRN